MVRYLEDSGTEMLEIRGLLVRVVLILTNCSSLFGEACFIELSLLNCLQH